MVITTVYFLVAEAKKFWNTKQNVDKEIRFYSTPFRLRKEVEVVLLPIF